MIRPAMYWEQTGKTVRCLLCPYQCVIPDGETGRCLARRNVHGILMAESYGQVTALALDPIEKKPLRRFYPGSKILSTGGYGCNLCCPFCQNHEISMKRADSRELSPEELAVLAAEAVSSGNIGVAYTYNEPLVGYEYVLDCAKQVRDRGLKNVLVSNGTINPEPLAGLIPWIDAMNIDLKCFSEKGYRQAGGLLEPVKETIRTAAACCHVEVTALIVPGISDQEPEFAALAAWLASVDKNIPLHISRYAPRYRYTEPATEPEKIYRFADLARYGLCHVYTGNC